ncbi:MAG: hypothetical protein WDM85_11045 [Caulobacteraceae bacterium]
MEEHGGELSLADAASLPGAKVTLRLPLAPQAGASHHDVADLTAGRRAPPHPLPPPR